MHIRFPAALIVSRSMRIAALSLSCAISPGLHAQAFSEAKTASDYSRADYTAARSCAAMVDYKSRDLISIRADSIAATQSTPEFCRVTGLLDPEIAFEVSLPARWNGRFYMIGNGGHAGDSLDDQGRAAQRNQALQLGFAFGQTNTGHDSRKEPGATFVLSNPQKAIDYAYRAVHLTAVAAKAITAKYYARPVQKAYWNSCSNGGRQGLIEAQRFPQDFDGVVANAPWVDQTGFTIGAMWNNKAISIAPLTSGKVALLAQKVLAHCDAIDGLNDGLISDPRNCDFDAARDAPACEAGVDNDSCLTAGQADAIMKIYRGPQADGKSLFPGFMPGSEMAWMGLIVPTQPMQKPADFNLAEGTMRYLVHTPPKPDYDYLTFDFEHDAPMLDAWGKLANAKSTDLSRFRRRGGKILMTYGWADQILQPLMGVRYYDQVAQRNGKRTPDFVRLFMVPGMTHCAGGKGPDQFDTMTAIINWVEKSKAPDSLIASKVVDQQVVRTRPLCPYPAIAKHSGNGSVDEAANFSCVAPQSR
jgi:pimeloyl-ACP methyl ester carboxylesterase